MTQKLQNAKTNNFRRSVSTKSGLDQVLHT